MKFFKNSYLPTEKPANAWLISNIAISKPLSTLSNLAHLLVNLPSSILVNWIIFVHNWLQDRKLLYWDLLNWAL